MEKKRTTHVIEIDADLKNLLSALDQAENKLSEVFSNSKVPKGLEKAFEKVKTLLGQISDKASKPLDIKGFQGLLVELDKTSEGLHSITRLVGEFSELANDVKIQFLPDDEKRKIEEATRGMEKYLALVTAATAKKGDLDKAQKAETSAEGRLKKAQNNVATISGKKEVQSAKLQGKKLKLETELGLEKSNPKKVSELRADIMELEASIKSLDGELKSANGELESAQSIYDSASAAVKRLSGDIKGIETNQLNELRETAKGLGIDWEQFKGKRHATQIELLTNAIEKQEAEIRNKAEPSYNEFVGNISKIATENKKVKDKVEETTDALKEQAEVIKQQEAFEGKIKQFLGIQGAAQLMRAALRDAMQTIIDLDATMADMAVVTDLNISDYWDQLPEYTQRANELGLAIGDVYKADTLFYQQGLKTNEVVAISTETMKMASIAGLDTAEATDRMTAALRGFNMELNEASAQKIADVYSELAAITAADVDEISTAMTKTASIASSAGMEFETTAAFLSQIIETTRESAETAGTAMKTVIARFQELKKSPDEIGEVDGEIVDANAIETALRSVGVSLRDASGQFRELDDVFLELSSKWDTLDKNTQRYIATIAAGSRQQSRFIAMMSDYKRTTELVTAANNSAGASQEQFEKKAESLEFKINQLKNAWHEFTMGIMDSDLVKFGVEILTKFLEIINKATGSLDGIAGSIGKIASILVVFKIGQKIFEKLKQPLANFFAEIIKQARETGEKAGKAAKEGLSNAKKEDGPTKEEIDQAQAAFGWQQRKGVKDMPKTAWEKTQETAKSIFGGAGGALGTFVGMPKFTEAHNARIEAEQAKYKLRNTQNLGIKRTQLDHRTKKLEKERGGLSEKEISEREQEIKNLRKEIEAYENAGADYVKNTQKMWNSIGEGISQAGANLTNFGVAASMVGGILSEMGLEDFGNGLAQVGQWATVAGTALSALGPIVTNGGKLVQGMALKLQAAGWSTQAAWWWVVLIAAAIAAVVAAVIITVQTIKNNSPEKKLEKAKEAAEKASEAAEKTADAYEHLDEALTSLGNKYEVLDKLTQSTKEWNNAIMEINDSVLDLIEKYPQLAAFVKSEDGVLKLEVDSAEVQKVLSEAKAQALMSNNIAALSNVAVSNAKKWTLREEYGIGGTYLESVAESVAKGELIIQDGTFKEGTKTFEELGYEQWRLDDILKYSAGNIDKIREYGNFILEIQEQERVAYSTMLLSAQQMANTKLFTPEQMAVAQNVFSEERFAQVYGQELNKIRTINYKDDKSLTDVQKHERDKAIKETYGENVKLEDLSNEDIQAAIAQTKTLPKVIDQIEYVPIMMDNFAKNNSAETTKLVTRLLKDKEGGELSLSDYNHLMQLSDEALNKIYTDLGANAENIFGSQDDFLKFIEDTKKIVKSQNKAMETSMKMMFGDNATLPQWNIPPEIGNQLLLKFQEVFNNASPEDFQGFYDQFDTIMQGLTEEQQSLFASIVEATDWQDTIELTALPDKLREAGLAIEQFDGDLYDFIETASHVSKAFAKLTAEELSKVLDNISDIMRNIKKGEQSRIFSEEQYSALLASDPALQKEFAKIADGYMYLGNNMEELRKAIIDNTSALIGGSDASLKDKQKGLDSITYVNTLMDDYFQKGQDYLTKRNNYEALKTDEEFYNNLEKDAEGTLNDFRTKLYNFEIPFLSEIGGAFLMDAFNWDEVVNSANEDMSAVRAYRNKLEKAKAAYESISNNKQYLDYKQNLDEMSNEQLQTYFKELSSKLSTENLNMSIFGINGLNSNIDFSTISLDTLKNWYNQINKLLDNEDFLIENNNKQAEIGNIITTATLGGTSTLADWYAGSGEFINSSYSTYSEEDANTILKGAMISLASQYDISDSILSNYFDTNGNVITEKFQEFIDLVADYEAEERNRPAKDKTIDLINQVKDALIESRQKEIDALAEKFDAIIEANNRMVDSLQELVSADRQRRENEKVEQNISDKYNQLAYLSMDSSGSGILEKLALQEEIKQAEQDYQDSLVDQAIQQLQDANQKAEEQRERQISLMQQQLDLWANSEQIWGEVNAIIVGTQSAIENGTSYGNSELAQLLSGISENLSEEEKQDFARDIIRLLQGYADYHAYATGGLADFTGPAWLDGTPSKPEYVLNATQTERFFSLVDILEGIDKKDNTTGSSGDNYFDINISVEKLENDYDVEKIADKIRRLIYDDASYRNVNAINHIR